MSNTDPQLLRVIRMAQAARGPLWKVLARRCKVSRSSLSLMLSGDKPMPPEVRERLIKELGLKKNIQRGCYEFKL